MNIKNIGESNFEFILSILTMLLLVLFSIKGSGRLSLNKYFRKGTALDEKLKNVLGNYNSSDKAMY